MDATSPYALCLALLASLTQKRPDLVADAAALLKKLNPRKHGPGFACVSWDGERYAFSASQARVVAVLWEAHENDTPEVRQELLLEAAGSESGKLADLFKEHDAWGTLIVPGTARGTYRLADAENFQPPSKSPRVPPLAPGAPGKVHPSN